MTRKEALDVLRKNIPTDKSLPVYEALQTLIPELRESEDEWIRKLLIWQVYRNIEDETNDLAQSVYDGIKGHDPDLEESIEDWKRCLAWLEKQKEQKPKAKAKSPLSPHELYDAKIEGISQGRQDVLDHPEQFGLQKPAEWSEEDKEKIVTISEIIEHCTTIPYSGGTLTLNKEYKKELLCFIKSLRPSWKPSEHQMTILKAVKDYVGVGSGYWGEALASLIEDLEKL